MWATPAKGTESSKQFPSSGGSNKFDQVTRHRRRGHSPRYTGDVGEPETKAHLRAELKVRIQSPPAESHTNSITAADRDG